MAKGSAKMVNRKRVRHTGDRNTPAVKAPISPDAIQLPSIPLAAVLSFLKETRGALTWTTQDMIDSLKISKPEANQIIGILSMQGYAKAALDNQGWLTTPAGEDVSGSKLPRYKLDSVNEALAILEKTIESVNQDQNAKFHISDAVAYGDFLVERPMVQAADVGIRLVPAKSLEFLKQLRGKIPHIQLHPYEPWMTVRSHRRLV